MLTISQNWDTFLRYWVFWNYVSASGKDVIEEWRVGLPTGAKAEMDVTIEYLRDRPSNEWGRPEFAPLGSGLFELRFKHANVQYRPLGMFGIDRNAFILLIGASKKGKSWTPHNALETAFRRKAEVASGARETTLYGA